MVSKLILEDFTTRYTEKFKSSILIKSFKSVSGGCINNGGRLSTSQGDFFIKWNSAEKFPGMFETEARGLKVLGSQNVVRIPKVIITGNIDSVSYLTLEYIESTARKSDYWEILGQQLANLHRVVDGEFGLDHNNYIGSLHQSNKKHNKWISFFVEERLTPQLQFARDSGKINSLILENFDLLFNKLDEIFPPEKPSLLHGDLWSGNLMTDDYGNPCLIDPAVYFGFREMDLAMTTLFGGFDSEFYESYQRSYPMETGWQERFDICNLYPLLVHVNLFGEGYLSSVKNILKRFD